MQTHDTAAMWLEIEARYPGDVRVIQHALETGAAFIFEQPSGFAVLSVHTVDYGERELYVWTCIGRWCAQYTDALRAKARELGCVRCTTAVRTAGLLRLMKRAGWTPTTVDLAIEV